VTMLSSVPVLLDADALNILAAFCARENRVPTWPANTILTPHAGEMKRLLDATKTTSAEALAQLLDSIIVAKGPTTQIVSPTKSVSSSTGTAALAKAGTGDVLSGIIASLMAQGATPFNAAVLGVEIHSRAGIVAEQKLGKRSVCAEDVIAAIPTVLQQLDTYEDSPQESAT